MAFFSLVLSGARAATRVAVARRKSKPPKEKDGPATREPLIPARLPSCL